MEKLHERINGAAASAAGSDGKESVSVSLQNITIAIKQKEKEKSTRKARVLLSNFSYTIHNGQVLTIMGGSGSGKSTLLHFITGVIDALAFECSGNILINGKNVVTLPTEKRGIGMLAQEGLLFPHMTVEENLLYALPYRARKSEQKAIVAAVLENAKLEQHLSTVYPYTLSGGQQARLSLARTLLSEPKILLLDEPFFKLDAKLRKTIRDWTWKKVEENGIPTLLVSHDENDIYDRAHLYHMENGAENETKLSSE